MGMMIGIAEVKIMVAGGVMMAMPIGIVRRGDLMMICQMMLDNQAENV